MVLIDIDTDRYPIQPFTYDFYEDFTLVNAWT